MDIFGVDVTPRVYYNCDGKAIRIVEFHMPFGHFLSDVTYTLTSSGDYFVWQFDPVLGETISGKIVPRAEVEEFYRVNLDLLPIHLILGQDRKTVDRVVREGQPCWEIKHLAA